MGGAAVPADRPNQLEGDLPILLEPTNAAIEGGCKGTLRFEARVPGRAAHSGRPWVGDNAIHKAGAVLDVLRVHEARVADVDGLEFREGLSAVGIRGGACNNVIPDECVVTINYRFAPDVSEDEAVARMRELFAPWEGTVTDLAGGARPGLDRPLARDLGAGLGVPVTAKQGWTDVARFSALGVPAVNLGPGDPLLAHQDDERCPVDQLRAVEEGLRRWLGA